MAILSFLRPNVKNAEHIKIMLPIGATLDIPTGEYIELDDGSMVLNGGLCKFWGIAGSGNSYKTAIMLYCLITAADRVSHTAETAITSYDTENTWDHFHIRKFMAKTKMLSKNDPLHSGAWQIIDKLTMWGDEWFEEIKVWVADLVKNRKKMMVKTLFKDRDGVSAYMIPLPTFATVDSMTEFEPKEIADIQAKIKLGDPKALTMFMKMGLAKVRLLSSIGTLVMRSGTFLLMSSHVGKEHAMSQGPMAFPEKKLATMKPGEKLKGVTDKFYTLLVHLWRTEIATTLKVSGSDRRIKWPRTPSEGDEQMGDLVSVRTTLLRSKTSPSGPMQTIIISQRDGVQPELTEFNNIIEDGRFGLLGGNTTYELIILPGVKISRTRIRQGIDTNPRLCRALNITSEMLQIFTCRKYDNPDLVCSPTQLYEDLITRGYDWDAILDSRGWHTVNDHLIEQPRLSTMDLLRMRIGLYEPKGFNAVVAKPKASTDKRKVGAMA